MNYVVEGEELFAKINNAATDFFLPNENNHYQPGFLHSKVVYYIVAALFAFKVVTIAFYIPFPQNLFFADITKADLVNLLNQNRQAAGVSKLIESSVLNQAAEAKARDMVQKNYFAHQSPQGTTPWYWFLQAGYKYAYAGENLAIGFADSPDVVRAWLNSPSHKANMVNPNYKEVGTAVLPGFGNDKSIVIVQLFGTLPAPKATAITKPAAKTPQAPVKLPQPIVQSESRKEALPPLQLPKVLAETTENFFYTTPNAYISDSFHVKILNFMVYHNTRMIDVAAMVLLTAIATCLLAYIVMSSNGINRHVVVKPLIMIAIIIATLSIDPGFVSLMLPYHVAI